MCTVSWVREAGGYHLLCNRDERRTRAVASGPRVQQRGGVRFIAPTDGNFGGTWIAVNEFGVSLCLLNGTAAAHAGRRSRGMLLRELISAESADECTLWLKQLDLSLFAPFSVVILEPDRPTTVAGWDGDSLALDPGGDSWVPLTSSSYDPAGVRVRRAEEFRRCAGTSGKPDSVALYWFHASHSQRPDAYSPCMHRADAETVSFSWVIVTGSEIRFFYSPASPCQCAPGEQQFLPRAA